MHANLKCKWPVRDPTVVWSIRYCAGAEIKLNKPKKSQQANQRISTVDSNEVSNGTVQPSHHQWLSEVRYCVILIEKSDINISNSDISS